MTAPTNLVSLGHDRGLITAPAAASIWRIDAALGRPLDVNSAYRDWDEQYRLWSDWINRVPGAVLALHPDDSWHCRGLAIDTDDRLGILSDHGWRFIVPSEPWHGQYYPNLDQHRDAPAGGNSTPIPTPEEQEDDMKDVLKTIGIQDRPGGQNQYWAVNLADNTMALITKGAQLDFRKNIGIQQLDNQSPEILDGFRRIDVR